MHRSGESISMILKNIMAKLKTALYLGFRPSLVVRYFFMQLCKMVQSFIGYLFRPLFNVVFNRKLFHIKDLMNFNSGIALVIILLLLAMIFQTVNPVNTQAKIKNGTTVLTYLLLILPTQIVIYQILIIQKFRTNTSAHTYLRWKTAIMQLNLTTD